MHPYEIHRGKWKIKQETGATMNHHTIHPGEIFNLHPGKLDTKRSAIILPSSMASPVFHPTLGNSSAKRRFRACVSLLDGITGSFEHSLGSIMLHNAIYLSVVSWKTIVSIRITVAGIPRSGEQWSRILIFKGAFWIINLLGEHSLKNLQFANFTYF